MHKMYVEKIITKANTILDCVGKTLHTTFGILFGGKTFIKTIHTKFKNIDPSIFKLNKEFYFQFNTDNSKWNFK